MKRVYANKDVCMGCKLCEVACRTAHSASGDVILAYTQEETHSCKTVHVGGELSELCLPVSCRHCDTPACITACIAGALTKDPETGVVSHEAERCVGCFSCVMVCPFGSILRSKDGKVAKCDLCEKRGKPACVDACPNAALAFEER